MMMKEVPVSIRWDKDAVIILDQTKLPTETVYIRVDTPGKMHECIKNLTIRGAGALSIGGAYGVYLGIQNLKADSLGEMKAAVEQVADYMATARPTAVKLFVMIDKIRKKSRESQARSIAEFKNEILTKCHEIRQENIEACKKIGEFGLTLFKDGMTVLTHCNAGSYATVERGSALSPFYLAKEKGINLKVIADETRPLLQGARLTAHELHQADIDVTLICDDMAAYCMQKGMIDAVIVSSDRIAANGDLVNKIGTYNIAIAANYHHIPFYMASTFASVDFSIANGKKFQLKNARLLKSPTDLENKLHHLVLISITLHLM
jgi:methylthioribose-1-phosphate isomerase